MPRALVSVSDKSGIVSFARGLIARGWELISTGGTARTLADNGLPVMGVADLTGFPEMMEGRVKTLHPSIHGGILARRNHPADIAALNRQRIGLIDLVAVNLYPFEQVAANPAAGFEELVEQIDIGGPTMVRAAAKNFRDVLVVVDSADYDRVLAALDATPSLGFRFELMRKAIAHTAAYDTAIAATLARVQTDGHRFARSAAEPKKLALTLEKLQDLRYGENPHQKGAWYSISGAGPGFDPSFLQGKELSFTNLLDLDAAARIVAEFDEPAAVVVKHMNPCGAATGSSASDAYIRARDADSVAAFGGIVGLNRAVDVVAAEAIVSTFIEAVLAPSVDAAAVDVFRRKPNLRIVTANVASARSGGEEFRSALGGVLVQDRDTVAEAAREWSATTDGLRVVTRRLPSSEEWRALRFAWRICAHVKSNTVIFTDAQRTLAVGAGQMSRVDAVNVAVMKARAAGISLENAVTASDAFFPFRDGLDSVAAAGATAVVQPGGSVRDTEVIAAADEHDLAMVFTGRRHFRH
jgi:phosphoribosylaminoimidazolecarboxamide formyltransferase/IMP cyclohydrolase